MIRWASGFVVLTLILGAFSFAIAHEQDKQMYGRRIDSLRALFPPTAEWVHVAPNGRDFPDLLWSLDEPITVSSMGCDSAADPSVLVRCIMRVLLERTDLEGTGTVVNGQALLKILPSGDFAAQFHQVVDGLPLHGAVLTLVVSADRNHLLLVKSSLRSEINEVYPFPPHETIDIEKVLLERGFSLDHLDSREYFLLETPEGLRHAMPVYLASLTAADGSPHAAVVDAWTYEFHSLQPATIPQIDMEMTANLSALEHTTNYCPSSAYCPPGYVCVGNRCLKTCATDGECLPFGTGWRCDSDVSSVFYHYCTDTILREKIYIFNSQNGWLSPGFAYFNLFSRAKDTLDRLSGWLLNYLNISTFNLDLRINVDPAETVTDAGNWSVDHVTWNVREWPSSNPTDSERAGLYRFLGHEFGHGLIEAAGAGVLPNECGGEIHGHLHGAMFAASQISTTWGDCGQSAYNDEVWGLAAKAGTLFYLDYALRSSFDNGPCDESWVRNDFTGQVCNPTGGRCPQYQYCTLYDDTGDEPVYRCNTLKWYANNVSIWERFARIWAEGTSTFSENPSPYSETQYPEFSGLGLSTTAQIYRSAVVSGTLTSSTSLEQLGYILVALSGSSGLTTQKALGTIGMPGGIFGVAPANSTDSAASQAVFSEWTLSPNRTFSIWKVAGTGNIRIRYYVGFTSSEVEWAANASGSPVVETYHGRLHIFWRDALDGSIRLKYFSPGGTVYGPYNLGTLGIQTSGDFDAALFNDSLYLVYVTDPDGHITISRCTTLNSVGCSSNTSYWKSWYGAYRRSYPWTAYPGLAAVSATGLYTGRGTSTSAEYLYIAFADRSTALGDARIALSRITTDEVVEQSDPIYVPDTAPSNRTWSRIALSVRNSALAPGKTHLFLFWRDRENAEIYGSVLQHRQHTATYRDVRPTSLIEPYWFTRPRLFRSFGSYSGVTILEQGLNQASSDSFSLLVVLSDGSVARVPFFGRY